jgi:hypothetical protein
MVCIRLKVTAGAYPEIFYGGSNIFILSDNGKLKYTNTIIILFTIKSFSM